MNTKQLLDYHKELCDKGRAIMEKKNHDYSGASGDTPFLNFEVVEKKGVCSAETGLLVRLSDKDTRIINFLKSGTLKVSDESLEDTFVDYINYIILLAAYIKQKKSKDVSVKVSSNTVAGVLKAFQEQIKNMNINELAILRSDIDKEIISLSRIK